MPAAPQTVDQVRRIDVDQYKYGFVTDIRSDKAPKGLSEDIVRFISAKKNRPEWMLAWRLDAYRRWLTMREPRWARVSYCPIDYQNLYYYAAPKKRTGRSRSRDRSRDPQDLRNSAFHCARWRCWSA
jgi:Fe-S cluster assembly protein SufB